MKRITCVTAAVCSILIAASTNSAEAKNMCYLTTPDTVILGQKFTVDLDAGTDAVDIEYRACIDELEPNHVWKSLKCITVDSDSINTRADRGDFHITLTAPAHLSQLTFTGSLSDPADSSVNNRSEPQTVDVVAPLVQTDHMNFKASRPASSQHIG